MFTLDPAFNYLYYIIITIIITYIMSTAISDVYATQPLLLYDATLTPFNDRYQLLNLLLYIYPVLCQI